MDDLDLTLRGPNPVAAMYFDVRDRFVGAVALLSDEVLAAPVPACPDWSVHELLTHVASLPVAIITGQIPDEVMGGGDPNPWIGRMVADNRHRSVHELAQLWASDDEALGATLAGAELLLTDLFIHEGDLHGAIGSNAYRNTAELASQLAAALEAVKGGVERAGLAPICVETSSARLCSSDGEPGWTLRVNGYEAHRALNSRRTRNELLALPHDGDPAPYLHVLDEHLPLPTSSLGEHRAQTP